MKWNALVSSVGCCALLAATAPARGAAPVIEHEPVRVALRGQAVSLIAKVSVKSGSISSVTLHYTQSRHGAPLKSAMQLTGMGMYSGTIPEAYISSASNVYYYIEAITDEEEWSETKYAAISVQDPGKGGKAAGSRKKTWGTAALIAGGAAGVVAGAIALSDSGGGGGGGGGNDEDVSGTYVGVTVLCFTPDGGSTSCGSNPTTVTIDANGNIASDDLAGGTAAGGSLSGDQFVIVVPADQLNPDHAGDVHFVGTVRNNAFSGTISGNVTTPTGDGEYSGTFTATKPSS